ncbi:MAG: AraC family transcriptional regulator [Lachnospiraceae bacterium]|jgi:AraC-like DNA-binding protein|nr:AraC family transcriptional regulator [Lachnospiraceae bacterium]
MNERNRPFHQDWNNKYKTESRIWHQDTRGISFLAHWHTEVELIRIREGSAEMHTAGSTFHASAGDLVICDSNSIHYYDSRKGNGLLEFLIFDPLTSISSHYANLDLTDPVIRAEQMRSLGLEADWIRLLHIVDEELEKQEPYYQEITRAFLRYFWFSMLRALPPQPPRRESEQSRQQRRAFSEDILNYLEQHYSEPITLQDAASRAGFSTCYFSRYFKELAGMNFSKYLSVLRVAHACDALESSDDSITDIALNCGFSNTRTFNRAFLSCTGMSPTAYLQSPHKGLL